MLTRHRQWRMPFPDLSSANDQTLSGSYDDDPGVSVLGMNESRSVSPEWTLEEFVVDGWPRVVGRPAMNTQILRKTDARSAYIPGCELRLPC